MSDREWFAVELPNGHAVFEKPFPNKEAAVEAARGAAPAWNEPLTVVKYTRREIRTFTQRLLIDEADVTAPAVSPS